MERWQQGLRVEELVEGRLACSSRQMEPGQMKVTREEGNFRSIQKVVQGTGGFLDVWEMIQEMWG